MQEQENVFLYTIHPKRAITGLTNIGTVRTAKSLFLTKEDVYVALKGASVYRRFANIGKNERVNVGNVDRLHRAEYISEEDWAKMQIAEAAEGNREVHVEPPVFEVKPEKVEIVTAEGKPIKLEELITEPEPVVEEPVVDTIVVPDNIETPAEPVVEEVILEDESEVEDEVEEVVDEVEEVVDEAPVENKNNQNRPNNKKKHRH